MRGNPRAISLGDAPFKNRGMPLYNQGNDIGPLLHYHIDTRGIVEQYLPINRS